MIGSAFLLATGSLERSFEYGFSSAVDNISSKYDIHHVTRNDLFIDHQSKISSEV